MITISDKITRVVCAADNDVKSPSYLIDEKFDEKITCMVQNNTSEKVTFNKGGHSLFTQLCWELNHKDIYRYTIDGGKAEIITKKTVDGERSFIENAPTEKIASAFDGKIEFQIEAEEAIYGLGQHENGTYNYRNVKEYLYQNNMHIPMPVFLSSNNYAILFDANCLMTYEEKNNIITVTFDAVDQIDYYIITGSNFDELIAGIRKLTGTAVLLPKWAFGYVQSKERYKTAEEIIETAETFEKHDIPVSCIVLDWLSWENGKWGNKIVDKKRFPDLKAMVDKLHEKGIAFMVSIWPNVNKGCEDNQELLEAGKLLSNLSTYDAFDEEARDIYWKQCDRDLFSSGTDAWWCDSTEPFTPDWNGNVKKSDKERYEISKESLTKYVDARNANAFALMHAKGIFEHQTEDCKEKRVVNLTRSGSLSIQKYGVILWSGDIKATWDVYKNQIAEGLNMCASGIPFWTLDIGAFFVGSNLAWRKWSNTKEGDAPWFWQGLFEDGGEDFGYRELYTRWLQFGTFLPIMRSHGTDTPREPWNFGKPGSVYYDTIVKYIKLRYRLLPYIYSLAAKVNRDGYTMMRSLMFDFAVDTKVKNIANEYMFGDSFLVCPVTEPMEYGPNNTKLSAKQVREVYLPVGADWYDYKTGDFYSGGQTILADAPIDTMPLYVRAGSIIPVSNDTIGTPHEIHVYEGSDGKYELYLDNGNDYSYEQGEYVILSMEWNNKANNLTIFPAQGNYPYPRAFHVVLHKQDGNMISNTLDYTGERSEKLF